MYNIADTVEVVSEKDEVLEGLNKLFGTNEAENSKIASLYFLGIWAGD